MVMMADSVSETVSLGPRPSFQQRSFYSRVDVSGRRRHKEQVTLRPVLTPVKYADTAYIYINNTRRRFVSRTFYEPRLQPKTFSETTFATPKTLEERYVSCLDHCPDESKKWYKTCLELKAKKFTSTRDFIPYSNSRSTNNNLSSNPGYEDLIGHLENTLVDENMNTRIPQSFQERYDPGASQVYIPKRSPGTRKDDLSQIESQILLNIPGNDNNFLQLNGHTDDSFEL